jgi:hypothetical protein
LKTKNPENQKILKILIQTFSANLIHLISINQKEKILKTGKS